MSWQDRFTFRDKRSVKHDVCGQEFRFYPNRMALLTEARSLSEPVAQAVNILFADQSRDSGSTVKRQSEGDFLMEDISTEPVDIAMAKHRLKERSDAIEKIMGTLADRRSLLLLGRMFMDSLREEFPYKKERHPSEIEEFLYGDDDEDSKYQGLDLPALMEMFQGWSKANALVFGGAGEKMVGLVKAKIEEAIADSSLETPDSTNGNSSKTPSSPQSDSDSEPTT